MQLLLIKLCIMIWLENVRKIIRIVTLKKIVYPKESSMTKHNVLLSYVRMIKKYGNIS